MSFSRPLFSACWWLYSSIVISLMPLSSVLGGSCSALVTTSAPSVRGRRTLLHAHCASPNMTIQLSLKFLHLFITSLVRLLPVFWLSALVDVLLSSSSLHWSENCLALEIQVSFSAAFHPVSNLEWKSSLLGNTFLLTCIFVILPLASARGASFLVNTNLCYNKVITNPTKTAYLEEFFVCSK